MKSTASLKSLLLEDTEKSLVSILVNLLGVGGLAETKYTTSLSFTSEVVVACTGPMTDMDLWRPVGMMYSFFAVSSFYLIIG